MRRFKFLFPMLFLLLAMGEVAGQEVSSERQIRTVTEYNVINKKKVLDHVTRYTAGGQVSEEIEYYSDGSMKSKTLYEYDGQQRCIKATKYGQKGKIEKVTTFGYDVNGQKILESSYFPDQRYRTDKVFEYSGQ